MNDRRTLNAGYDVMTPDAGTHQSMTCTTCGAVMDVTRGVNGPTGFAEAMGGGRHLHDRFVCPNAGRGWHDQAIGLLREMRATFSMRTRRAFVRELNGLLRANGSTLRHSASAV